MVAASGPLRVVFFGTPDFAVPTLDALLASRHQVIGVVTQPDRPRGRGQRTSDAPVKARAVSAGILVLQPQRLREPGFVDALAALRPDVGVVAAYGKILTAAVLQTPPLGCLNVHASLLPRFRGAAPVHRAIIEGDRETGVTIMRMVEALDAGPMLAVVRRSIGADETSDALERDLARLGARLLVDTLADVQAGRARETPQDESVASYAPRLTKEDGRIDWTAPAERVHNLIRGLHPWPHAFTFLSSERLILRRSTVAIDATRTVELPGTIVEAAGRLRVAAGSGALDIVEIQTEGRRPMPTREFLAGHPLRVGERFQNHP